MPHIVNGIHTPDNGLRIKQTQCYTRNTTLAHVSTHASFELMSMLEMNGTHSLPKTPKMGARQSHGAASALGLLSAGDLCLIRLPVICHTI